MTALDVVVANVCREPAEVAPCVESLRRELGQEDRVVWVDAAGVQPDLPRLEYLPSPDLATRGALYARGLAAARQPLVAFTDSRTRLEPGWRAAAVSALAAGAHVVGGPVLTGPRRGSADAAGFLVEYGPHAVAPFTSATGDVSANNVAYDRAALETVVTPGEPVWKSVVNTRLAARGRPPVVAPAMRAVSVGTYRRADIGAGRLAAGRLYGAHRAGTWSLPRRAAAAAACAALPMLAYARLAARVAPDPALRSLLARSTPAVLVALASWSAGEAWGYLRGEGSGAAVF